MNDDIDVKDSLLMTQSEKSPIPRLRVINPLDWMRLLWWGLVTSDRLKAYQKIYGKKGHKRVAGALISTLLWSPMFIVMSGTVIHNQLIRVYVISPVAPIIMTVATFAMWLITWFLIATLDRGDESASYSPNNILPFGIGALFSYITLEGFIGGGMSAVLAILIGIVLVATCDTVGKRLKTNAEGMIGLGIFTGIFIVTANQLLNRHVGIPLFVTNVEGFSFIGLAIFVISAVLGLVCMGLVTMGVEWFIEKTKIGGKVMFTIILSSVGILIWLYYLGGWQIFQMPPCGGC